ncbi:MAG: insulinase family protein [Planctomycetes bacterium]|nr:insulinase family protein [Planctomycetota bacterium]
MREPASLFVLLTLASAAPCQSAPQAGVDAPRIVTIPVDNAASIAVVLGVRAGVYDEADGWNGAAHLVEHLVLNSPAGDLDDPFAVLSKGGPLGQPFVDCNAETMWAGTYFYSLRPAPPAAGDASAPDLTDLERTLGVFADMLHQSRFDDATLAQERPRAVAEVRNVAASLASNPRLRWMLEQQARLPKAGTEADMTGLTLDELVAFRRAHYRPERCVLIVAGRIDAEQVRDLAGRVFQRAAAAAPSDELPPLTAKAASAERVAAVRTVLAPAEPAERVAVRLAAEVCAKRLRTPAPRAQDADAAAEPRPLHAWVETPADGSVRIAIAPRSAADGEGAAAEAADTEGLERALVVAMRSLANDPPSDAEVRSARRAATTMVRQRILSSRLRRMPDGDAGHRALLQAGIDRVLAELDGGVDFTRLVEQAPDDAVRAAGRRIAASVGGD